MDVEAFPAYLVSLYEWICLHSCQVVTLTSESLLVNVSLQWWYDLSSLIIKHSWISESLDLLLEDLQVSVICDLTTIGEMDH